MPKRLALAALLASAPAAALAQASSPQVSSPRDNIDALIETHARANKVPSAFVHRVIKRESNYNPRAKGGSALGLMQIKHATARGLGYGGEASGLFDPEINLKYGIAYLAGAYRAARGDLDQAYRYYNRGYYYAAKQLGITNAVPDEAPAAITPAPVATGPTGFASLFGLRTNSAATVQTASAEAGAPLAYAATSAGSAQAVEVPLPPQRPAALAGTVATQVAVAETAPPQATAGATAAQPAAQAGTEQIEVPLPPRRPAAVQLAAVKRPAPAAKTDAGELLQAAAQ